jgi:hypothetical protein
MRRPTLVLLLLLAALVASCTTAGASARHAQCTHGASSIGPVQLVDGHPVGTVPAPATETCLP